MDFSRSNRTRRSKARKAILNAVGNFELLEDRRLLSVSVDSNGFTQVTPSPDSRQIYVSTSGSDANSGLSPSAPVASIARAYSLLRTGYPDWILFERGDTFTDYFASFSDSGRSAQEPAVVTSYGDPTLPQPVIDATSHTAFRVGDNVSFVDILGVTFTSSTHNPTSPNYNGQGDYGFYDLGDTNNLLIENCTFSYFVNDLTFQGYYGPLNNITISRNQILDSYSTDSHSEGMFADTTNNLTIVDNVFDHDGWNADVPGAQATIYNHDCYLHSSDTNCVITGNTFADAGSFGLQARGGGIVENNLFVGDPYGFSFGLVNGATTHAGGVGGLVEGNVVIEPRADASGWGIGAMFGNLGPQGTTISDNIFADAPGSTGAAMMFTPGVGVLNPTQEVGINNVTVSGNTVYNWGFGVLVSNQYVPGSTGRLALNNVVFSDNNFQDNATGRIISHGAYFDAAEETWSDNTYSSSTAPQSQWYTLQGANTSFSTWQKDIEPTASASTVPFFDPARSIESYMGDQGLAASLAAFVAGARTLSDANWNSVYFAGSVISYIEVGFSVGGVVGGRIVVTPPPTVTTSNYLTNPDPTFTVTYSDPVGINLASLSGANLSVVGPDGVTTVPVSLVSTSGGSAALTVAYQLNPSTSWASLPSGMYIISLNANQVLNAAGIAEPAQAIGSFQVNVQPVTAPIGPPTAPTNLAATAGSSAITVSWSDPLGDAAWYVLQRSANSTFTGGLTSIVLGHSTTSYVDNVVVPGQDYYYRIFGVNTYGQSFASATVFAGVKPAPPALTDIVLNDGNPLRTAVGSITLAFSEPVNLLANGVDYILTQSANGGPTYTIPTVVTNPSGDGRLWIIRPVEGSTFLDGNYTLTVVGSAITDSFGQTAGGTTNYSFTSVTPPTVTAATFDNATPTSYFSATFSQNVAASLSASTLQVTNSSGQTIAATGFSYLTGVATWSFPGPLPDDSYTFVIPSSEVVNASGVHLDGVGDGIAGTNFVYDYSSPKPTLTLSGNRSVNYGAPYGLTLGAITDPDGTNPTYVVHWGDGTSSTYLSAQVAVHTYPTARGATNITVDVVDSAGTHPDCASYAIAVDRAQVSLAGSSLVANPGEPYTLDIGAVSDPGFTVSQYIVHWGDGVVTAYTSGGDKTHVYTNNTGAPLDETITVDLVDNGGLGGSSFTNVTAGGIDVTLNEPVTLPLLGGLNTNIGGNYALVFGTPVDPGFTPISYTVHWGDGSAAQTFPASDVVVYHTFKNPGADTITADLTDNGGTTLAAGAEAITVNGPPTVSLSGGGTASVGSTYTLTVPPANDPGQTVLRYTINWGDGTITNSTSPGNFNHVYSSQGAENIVVGLTDATGTYPAAGTLQVNVATVPITIALGGSTSANAGGTYSLTLGAVTDQGQTPTGYTVHWGDGSTNSYSATGTVTHTYSSVGNDTIAVDLTDGAGTHVAVATLPVAVSAPAINLQGNSSSYIGQTYMLTLNPTDAGGTPSKYIVHWGDGSSSSYATAGVVGHVYSAPTDANITVDLVDNTGTFTDVGSLSVNVVTAPTATISGAANTNVGATYSLSIGNISDKLGTVSGLIVHWGDGTSSNLAGAATAKHVYGIAGPETISLDILDNTGTWTDVSSQTISVNQPSVVLSGLSKASSALPYSLTIGNVFDPGQTVSSYKVHWGDGSTTSYSSAGIVTHSYQSLGNMMITVDLTDGIGTYSAVGSTMVNISNTPTLTLSGPANVRAGANFVLTASNIVDPNGTPEGYFVHWGDGSTSVYKTLTGLTHKYATAGAMNISVDLMDKVGVYNRVASAMVTVSGAPTVAVNGAIAVQTGAAYSLTVSPATDPGYTPTAYTVHWGDGTSSTYKTAGAVTHTYTAIGAKNITVDVTDATGTYSNVGSTSMMVQGLSSIAGRYVFYNDSSFNGNTTAATTADFKAIATDKQALLPGHTATFANYTSYTKGINGIIIDIANLPLTGLITANDFAFKVGNSTATSSWTSAPTPTGIFIYRGQGTNGSDRIVITFADNSIVGKWLQVTVLPTVNTGLTKKDVFYFGNAPGSTGVNKTSAMVTSADVTVTKAAVPITKAAALPTAAITSVYDFNRDGYINSADVAAAQADETNSNTALKLIGV